MKQTFLFTKTKKEIPKDELSVNAQFLLRGGFIAKELAGAYAYLPLGLRVLSKIINIIREEMNAVGGQEVYLTSLQSKETWEKTGRWSDDVLDVWFKTHLKNGGELGLATTHEEPLTALMKQHVTSYSDLPLLVYQFQTKFRNELRAKSGILRAREFIMKDLYSFVRSPEEHEEVYTRLSEAYVRIFDRVGIGSHTYRTFASGGSFSKYSHEFQTICDVGEDTIYVNRERRLAVNKEVFTDDILEELNLRKESLEECRGIEVGNIFTLGTRFSEPLSLSYQSEQGKEEPVIMGSYGIGPGRVMGTVVELFHDDAGPIWPLAISPFHVHLISLCQEAADVQKAEDIYQQLTARGVEVLYDDRREVRPGQKFAESDLIGIPFRVVVSPKTIEKNALEVKKRGGDETLLLSQEEAQNFFQKYVVEPMQ